ncbi:MAG: carboxypeptidase-like regulatory domain-containing protein [Bacteroidia bacterium]|nr:carboxypeptidase-like regulatory domain-containing protein [Bacteroidia bacterium]
MKKIFALLIFSVVTMGYVSAQKTVTGNISGEDGLGLIGANVLEKGTSNGTITDFDGNFELAVSADDAVLVISYAGYTTQEIDLAGQSNVSIVMAEGQMLEEVVVVGYSESSRLTDVASVSSVSAENIQNRPTPNVLSAVQGQIPGFMTSASSGQPGSVQQVRIRGTGSITAGRNPLYVIDGVIMQTG